MTTIEIEPVTRIESHGRLTMEFDNSGNPVRAFFSTPILRGFEAFLKGAPVERVPWLTSRVCGVCPVSHAVNSAQTLERALGVTVPDTARNLREMLVLAQVIDSHALSFAVLSLPDLVPKDDVHSIVDIKQSFPDLFEKGMKLHTLGRTMTAVLGGRNVHPANVQLGGMSMNPLIQTEVDFSKSISESLEIAKEFLSAVKEWFGEKEEEVKSIGSIQSNYMALSNGGKVSFVQGDVKAINPDGVEFVNFSPDDYLKHLAESTEPHTYMKLPYLKAKGVEAGLLRVNCLARANVNESYGTTIADQELAELHSSWGKPLEHSLLSHYTRLLEVVYACEKLTELLNDPATMKDDTSAPIENLDGAAAGCVEAPRGTLFHDYTIENGHITKANLIVATQNNALAVNRALTETLKLDKSNGVDQDKIVHHCEMVIRAYDPCISCSTHMVRTNKEGD